jgi:predicted DsbA family dithiol-disulfide isomerase
MKVEIYFDVVCPWCYIGERRFEKALEATGADDLEIAFRPFQLDPSAPAEARPIGEYLGRRFGAMAAGMQRRVSEFAADAGIEIDWDRALMANTLTAHRLVRLAELEYSAEVQRALVEALFRAHFTDGVDVGDRAALIEIATSVGMDGARAAEWLESAEADDDVRGAIAEARAIGVQSVPTFVFDERYAIEGAQAVETFVEAIRESRERSAAGAHAEEND